jgi:hypothetical protein
VRAALSTPARTIRARRPLYDPDMHTPLVFTVFLALAACQTPDVPAQFAAAVRVMPADGKVILEFRDGRLTRYAASVDPATVPAAARRTADEIVQPGGKSVFVGREWSIEASGYRFVKVYEDGGSFRTVLVDADGKVLARSHQIPVQDCPAMARDAIHALGSGKILRVEVVQRQRGTKDIYRFGLVDDQGRRWFAVVTAAGFLIERGREVDAQISAGTR